MKFIVCVFFHEYTQCKTHTPFQPYKTRLHQPSLEKTLTSIMFLLVCRTLSDSLSSSSRFSEL